jgi:hypothetical protein
LPTQCIYEFGMDVGTSNGISLCGINWLVLITEMYGVYCAVRDEYKYNSP